jgi:hypothetical protein
MAKQGKLKRQELDWQTGRLEIGCPTFEVYGNHWTFDEPDCLFWVGLNGETAYVGKILHGSNSVFDGRSCMAALGKRGGRTFFVNFPTHYVSTAISELECREVLDDAPNPLDQSKAVLCKDGRAILVLPVQKCDPVWVAAAYRLRSEVTVERTADLVDLAVRARLREQLEADQAIRDRFLVAPIAHREDVICETLISADGGEISWVQGCTFTGLVPTPTPAESLRLMGELDRLTE